MSGSVTEKCLVCGLRATGVHYGVQSCEGCKAFYKRGLGRSHEYKCYFGNTCFDNGQALNRCKSCRFRKCAELGMDVTAPKRGRRVKEINQKRPSPPHAEDSTESDTSDQQILHSVRFPGTFHPDPHKSNTRSLVHVHVSPHTTHNALDRVATFWRDLDVVKNTENAQSCEKERPRERVSVITRAGASDNAVNPISKNDAEKDSSVSLGSLVTFRKRVNFNSVMADSFTEECRTLQEPSFRIRVLDDSADNPLHGMPSFLTDYWETVERRGLLIKNTINRVTEAIRYAYGDFFPVWDSFMAEIERRGTLPPRPNVPLSHMVDLVKISFEGYIKRACRFLFLLPGFAELDQADQAILLMEKFTEHWLFCHAPYLGKNGEWHVLIGPNADIHLSQYWMRQMLVADQYELVFSIAEELNDIDLTRVEQFLLVAVATFQPEYTTARNKTMLAFLGTHYMDCLLHSIRGRCPYSQQLLTEMKVHNFMRLFRSLYRLGNFYVRLMKYDTAPFKAIDGAKVVTVEEALSKEDDGLQPMLQSVHSLSISA